MMGIRVLVTGGRDYIDADVINSHLDRIHTAHGIDVIMNGAATGADFLSSVWAEQNYVRVQEWEADWKRYGKSAGPIRNQAMLDEGRPDLVVAFPGGRGTEDMKTRALLGGFRVEIIRPANSGTAGQTEVSEPIPKARTSG